MPKTSIRRDMLARRKSLPAATCLALSFRAQQRLLESPEFAAAGTVALYSAIRNEVFTEAIFAAASKLGKTVVYPRVGAAGLEFVEVSALRDLGPGAFGILEPTGSRTVPLQRLDLVVVPGVAFDFTGHRLGYGKGFYDRVLHGCERRGVLVGLGFELQLVEALPVQAHDVRMDMIVTEERTLGFRDLSLRDPKP